MDVIGSAPQAGEDDRGDRRPRVPPPLRIAAVAVVAVLALWVAAHEPFADRLRKDTTPRPGAPDFALAIGAVLGEPRSIGPTFQVVVDDPRWYALVARCSGPGRCTEQLSVSTDRGSSWQRRRLPVETGPGEGRLRVVASSALQLTTPRGRWLTRDDGQSWRTAAMDLWVTPPSPLLRAAPSDARPADGSRWASGTDAAGRPAVAVSRDFGSTWQARSLPVPPVAATRTTVLTLDGTTAFALVLTKPPLSPSPHALAGIARTDDGGRTWRSVPPTGPRPATAVAAALLPDGRLLVSVESPDIGLFVSGDGGRSFAVQPDAPSGLTWFGNTGDQLLAEGGGYVWVMKPTGQWHLLKP